MVSRNRRKSDSSVQRRRSSRYLQENNIQPKPEVKLPHKSPTLSVKSAQYANIVTPTIDNKALETQTCKSTRKITKFLLMLIGELESFQMGSQK